MLPAVREVVREVPVMVNVEAVVLARTIVPVGVPPSIVPATVDQFCTVPVIPTEPKRAFQSTRSSAVA